MAAGVKAGTVYIDVEPDTSGFYRKVKAMLERLDDHRIDLDADVDLAGVRSKLERLQRSGGTIEFDARINTTAFDKVHKQLAELASATDIDVDVDTSDFDKSLNEAMNRQRARVKSLGEEQKRTWREGWKFLDENTAKHKELSDSILSNKVAYAQLGKSIEEAVARRNSFKRGTDEYKSLSEEVKALRKEYAKLGRSINKQKKELVSTEEARRKFLGDHEKKLAKINAEYDEQAKLLRDMPVKAHNRQLKELSSNLLKAEGRVDALRRTMSRVQFIDTDSQVKAIDDMSKRVSAFQKQLLAVQDSPAATVKFRTELDESGLREDLARLQRDVEVEVRVNAQQAALERLQRELSELEHRRVNIPVDLKVDYETAIAERKRLIEQIRKNPELDWEVKSNVDIDEANARRKLRDLQNDYETLSMDVDLETALARAHLAYFTRPRTVDIFAKFHGTDLGKILGGMTAGATGLQGVRNQFQNLVNLFDRLDKVVPKVALVGTVLSDVAAGAINLAGTVGGLGKSIVTMSKAAYAAPAALTGMGLAYSSLRMIIGENGAAWTENINLAGTALEGLGEKLQDTFYGKAAPAFKDFANQVGNVVGPQMQRLASLEADVFTGMLDMVSASNKVGQVGRVFTHVNDSVKLLVPGVESVVRAFLDLSDAGGMYLSQFSNWISRNMEWFSTWARTVQADTSTVDSAMAKVKEQAGYLADSFFALKDIASGVFGALGQNQNGLEQFAATLKKAEDAVNSISFQDTMNAWVRGAQEAQHGMRDAFGQIGDAANIMRNDVANVMASFGELTGNVFGDLTGLLSRVSPSISKFADGVKDGFSSISGALKDASPMFSQLVSMAGELSRTFGGTFASTLKAAAPMIEQVAKATESVAKAFNALPDAVKGAAGLWMTFGRSGVQAFSSLKQGMLENIQNTLQYRGTLAELGLSAGEAGISFGQLVKAQIAMRNGNIAGVLSQTGSNAAEMASNMGKATGKAGGLVGGLKNVGSAVLGAFGGVPGLVGTAAAVIGGGAIMTAISSYSQHVSDLKSVQDGFNEAMRATPGTLAPAASSLDELANRMDNFAVKTKEAFSQQRSFWDNINPARTDFNTINDALDKIGMSVDDVSKATGAGRDEFEKYGRQLSDISNTNMRKYLESSGDVAESYKEQSDAASTVLDKMNDLRQTMLDELKVKAVLVGKTAEYVDQLDEQGQSIQSISAGLVTAEERMQTYAAATSKVSQMLSDQRSAWTKAQAAGSSYYSTLDQMPSMLEQVRAEVEQGNSSWKNMAEGFDLTTESGRSAADAMSALASNANAYIDAMVARGDSWDTVNGKYSELRKNLEETARQAGVAEEDVSAYVDTLLGTPESIKTRIELQGLEQQSQMVSLIEAMQVLFPDGSRDQTRKFLLKAVAEGTLSVEQLSNMLKELSDGKHEITLNANGDQAVTVLSDAESLLRGLSANTWWAYVQARAEGKSDVDALKEALESTPEARDAFIKAHEEGKSDVDALKAAIDEINSKKVKIDADTDGVPEKIAALEFDIERVSNSSGIKIDANIDPAIRKIAELNGWAVDDKTGEIYLSDDQYKEALKYIDGIKLDPKTGELLAESNEYTKKLAEVNGWTIEDKTGRIILDDGQALSVSKELQALLGSMDGKVWKAFISALVSGQSEVDALKTALDTVPEYKDAFLEAHQKGMNDVDALKYAIEKVTGKKVVLEADTDPANAKMSAYINDQSAVKTIPADIALGEADAQLATWASVVVKKPVQTEVEQPSLMGTIASITSLITSTLIPPAKIRVEGDDTDAQTKINAVRAFGGKMLAEMWAHILGEDSLARSSIGAIAAYDGRTIAKPWARVQGEHTLASAAIRAISSFNGKTIAKPWARVQGENAMARAAIAAVQAFNGLTIARPWARVQGDDSGAQAVFSAIASTNGSVLATRYVDIVTRSSGEVKAATGGRIHGPGSGTSDSIPAMLSNNEHVIRAAAVSRIDREVGPNFLNVLNRTGDLSKALANANNRYLDSARSLARGAYASGGRVRTMFSGAADVHVDGGKTVNQTFNLQTKVVRSDQDLHAAAQIDRAALMRNARREARL